MKLEKWRLKFIIVMLLLMSVNDVLQLARMMVIDLCIAGVILALIMTDGSNSKGPK